MLWRKTWRADPRAAALADRHYNRQAHGSAQFAPPGRCVVLITPEAGALWVTSWPFAEYVQHRWAGAWVCSIFRRELGARASEMIRDAVAATRWAWTPPALGLVTFLDREKVRPVRVRGRETWGRTWLLSGFEEDGETEGGLLAFRLRPERMPAPRAPLGAQLPLFVDSGGGERHAP